MEEDADHPNSFDRAQGCTLNEPAAELPFLTADVPGIGGRIKEQPEDFVVEEIAAYEPTGDGEHLFLWVEKRDVSAEQLIRHVSRALRISRDSVGTAGMKDRRAMTRQYVSVPARCEPDVWRIETDAIRVLGSRRHGNKLRTGHLKGNRFAILVRGADAAGASDADAILAAIRECGFPNYFGTQRFGRDGETLRLGWETIRGGLNRRIRNRRLFRLSLSAVQSLLFNRVLAERIADGLASRVLAGDVMQVVHSGGLFVADDPEVEEARLEAGEIAVTGPMFGPKMIQPRGEPAQREARVLAEAGLTGEEFGRWGKLAAGTRRAFMVRPRDLSVEWESDGLRLKFELPSGAYATSLLRELMKAAPVSDEGPDPCP